MRRFLRSAGSSMAILALVSLTTNCTPLPKDEALLYGGLIAGILWLDSQVSPCERDPARTNVIGTGVLWSSSDAGSLTYIIPPGSIYASIRTAGSGPFLIQMQTNPGISGVIAAYDRGRQFARVSGEDPMLSGLISPMTFLCIEAGIYTPNEHFQIQIN